jgi:hypothetical protein
MKPKRFIASSSMRRSSLLCTVLIVLLLPVMNCKKQDAVIDQGVQGTVLFWRGDFQCCPIKGSKLPVQREVCVFELTNEHQVTNYGAFYDTIQTKMVAKTTSNDGGFYQLRLAPGRYSLFVKEGQYFYMNSSDGYGNIQPFEVVAGSLCQLDIDITYMAVF